MALGLINLYARKRKQSGSSDLPSQSSMTCIDLCYPKTFAAWLRRVSATFRIRDESRIYYRDPLIPGTISGSGGKEPHCQTLSIARHSSGRPRKIISLKLIFSTYLLSPHSHHGASHFPSISLVRTQRTSPYIAKQRYDWINTANMVPQVRQSPFSAIEMVPPVLTDRFPASHGNQHPSLGYIKPLI